MRAPKTKSNHTQPSAKAAKAFFEQAEDRKFFSESDPEQTVFFNTGDSPTIQTKAVGGQQSFFQPSRVPTIQAKCAEFKAEEQQEDSSEDQPEVQRMLVFGSGDEGDPLNDIQRMQAFESEEASVQTKLTVGQPGDKYEQAADAMADQVMAMPEPEVAEGGPSPEPETLQRFSDPGKVTLQRQPLEEEDTIQAKQQTGQAPAVTPSLEARLNTSKGVGEPLSEETRGFMEPRFGQDFSGVQVHRGADAIQMNRELGAQAFTHGQDVYFGAGKYRPETGEGKRLLAHELTHVVQQSKTSVTPVQRKIKVREKILKWNQIPKKLRRKLGVFGMELIRKMHKHPSSIYQFDTMKDFKNEILTRYFAKYGVEKSSRGCYSINDKNFYLDKTYWNKESDTPPLFKVKPESVKGDKGPADAVKAIFKPGAKTVLECDTMAIAIQYYALVESLGEEEFNRRFPGGKGIVIRQRVMIFVEKGKLPETEVHPIGDEVSISSISRSKIL